MLYLMSIQSIGKHYAHKIFQSVQSELLIRYIFYIARLHDDILVDDAPLERVRVAHAFPHLASIQLLKLSNDPHDISPDTATDNSTHIYE